LSAEPRPPELRQFRVDEFQIELGVVDHQRRVRDEVEEFLRNRGEDRLA
jgi:hypothetical protein